MIKVLTLHIPNYIYDQAPNSVEIGQQLDKVLEANFYGKTVVVRGVDLRSHEELNLEGLVEYIRQSGTDKYDKNRKGIADHVVPEEFRDKFIYGDEITLDKFHEGGTEQLIHSLHHGALGDRGYSVRADIILVYDRADFTRLRNIYAGTSDSDIFIFEKPPKEALLGIIKITQ
jgi:hypothetical protein